MTQWGLDTLFNPAKRHMDEEKRRLQSTREEVGDNSGGRRIDLESGKVVIARDDDTAETVTDDTDADDTDTDGTDTDDTDTDGTDTDGTDGATHAAAEADAGARTNRDGKPETDAQRRARLRRAKLKTRS